MVSRFAQNSFVVILFSVVNCIVERKFFLHLAKISQRHWFADTASPKSISTKNTGGLHFLKKILSYNYFNLFFALLWSSSNFAVLFNDFGMSIDFGVNNTSIFANFLLNVFLIPFFDEIVISKFNLLRSNTKGALELAYSQQFLRRLLFLL